MGYSNPTESNSKTNTPLHKEDVQDEKQEVYNKLNANGNIQ